MEKEMPTKTTVFISLLLLSACASDRDIAAEQAAIRQQVNMNEDSTCRSYGLKYGTTEYANCRQNQASQRSQQDFIDDQMRRQMMMQMMMRRY
jgi:hypothetical protein